MKRIVVFLVLFLGLSLYFLFPFFQAEEKGMETLFQRYDIHGASVTVLEDGAVSETTYFGYAHREEGDKLEETHHMRAESISKTIAAAAVLHLVENTDIALDDSLYDHIDYRLPASAFDASTITIRHILDHTSGITGGSDYEVPCFEIPSRESVLRGEHSLHKAVMVRAAGERFEYSNQAFMLLEFLIEDNSPHTFEEYVETHIFTPLGMGHTTYDHPATLITSYDLRGDPVPPHRYPFSAPGGLYTSGEDLVTFFHGLSEGVIIPQSKVEEMFSFSTQPKDFYAFGADGVGLGVFLDKDAVFHAGEGSGSLSQVFFYPEEEAGFAVMTNDKTAWEFLYAASGILALSLDRSLPRMSVAMLVGGLFLYGVIALLMSVVFLRVLARVKHFKAKTLGLVRPAWRPALLFLYPWLLVALWMVLRTVMIRNLLFTLSLHVLAALVIFAVVNSLYVLTVTKR